MQRQLRLSRPCQVISHPMNEIDHPPPKKQTNKHKQQQQIRETTSILRVLLSIPLMLNKC